MYVTFVMTKVIIFVLTVHQIFLLTLSRIAKDFTYVESDSICGHIDII